MAPVAPLGRKGAMKLVAEGALPFWFGSPHPTMMILEQDGVFRIRALVIDEAEARAKGDAAIARGEPWMPEQYYELGKPTGKIYAEASSTKDLLARMENMDWPAAW